MRAARWFIGRWRELRGEASRARRLRELLAMLRPYRARVALMFVALIVSTLAALAPPFLAKHAIDDGIIAKNTGVLVLIVALFAVSALVNWGATYAQTFLTGWVGQRVLQNMRIRLFGHLQAMPVDFYARRKTGVLVSRLTNDVQALDQLVTDGVVTLFSSTVTLIAVTAILLTQDVPLALATFTVFPLVAAASFVFRVVSTGVFRATRERIAAISAYLQETISGVGVVRAYGQEPRHVERFRELNEANRVTHMKTVYLNAAYFPAVELLSAIGTAVILLYGGSRALSGDLTIGVLVLFVGYVQIFFDPIQQLSQLYTTYQAGMAALDKIFDLLAEQPGMSDRPGAVELGPIHGAIEFEDVWFSYDPRAGGAGDGGGGAAATTPGEDGTARGALGAAGAAPGEIAAGADRAQPAWALRGIDIAIAPGETIALVGATGAGKSTFAKLVARFHDPARGRVTIDGHDLRDVRVRSLRTQLGYVPQEGYLFSGSVADNIAFGRPGATRDEVEQAARAVGVHELVAAMPDGYDTAVGERGSHLSAGQRQLIAFARALCAQPRLLILDEATASVDVRSEARIESAMRRLLAGRTAIVIAHRLSTIQRASRIAVLDHGRIVELGTHAELVDAGGRYSELYTAWAESAA